MTKPRSIFSAACNPFKVMAPYGEFLVVITLLLLATAYVIATQPHNLRMGVKAEVQVDETQKIEAYLAAHSCTVHDLNGIVVNSFMCAKSGATYNISARDVRTAARAGTAPVVELLRTQTATNPATSATPATPAARLQFPNDL